MNPPEKRKKPGHYSGLFQHTLFFGRDTTPNEESLPEAGYSACHQLWGQGAKNQSKRKCRNDATFEDVRETCGVGNKIDTERGRIKAWLISPANDLTEPGWLSFGKNTVLLRHEGIIHIGIYHGGFGGIGPQRLLDTGAGPS